MCVYLLLHLLLQLVVWFKTVHFVDFACRSSDRFSDEGFSCCLDYVLCISGRDRAFHVEACRCFILVSALQVESEVVLLATSGFFSNFSTPVDAVMSKTSMN